MGIVFNQKFSYINSHTCDPKVSLVRDIARVAWKKKGKRSAVKQGILTRENQQFLKSLGLKIY